MRNYKKNFKKSFFFLKIGYTYIVENIMELML